MDAFTQIIVDAIKTVDFDRRALRTAGGDSIDDRRRREIVAAFLKHLFYEAMLSCPLPEYAGRTLIEAWERRVDWNWVARSVLTEEGLN